MKTNFFLITSLLISAILLFNNVLYSQGCERQDLCDDLLGEGFIYQTQSRYGTLPMGETKRIKTPLLSGKRYRIVVCCDPDVGNVDFKVIKPIPKTVRKIKEIKKDTIIQYKTDDYGEILYPEENNYEPIEIGRQIQIDTLWETVRIIEEKVLYDSKKTNDKPYWEESIESRGYSVYIEAKMPDGDPDIEECVNIYVGSKPLSKKRMGAAGKYSLWD
ncbi:MAG: hypothetical protein Kow0068_11500 [Marinilabiliales bacterium]